MKFRIITNNPLVHLKYKDAFPMDYHENATFLETMEFTRSKVHSGHEILTHPLTGSVKPGETPFKSIIISEEASKLNFDSLKLIEDAILTTKKFVLNRKWTDKIISDFKLIDCDIITSGIESINQIN
ncbi:MULTISPECIES: GrdX family protein [Psychrilyobacter]|uniref:GrdX protein n=1 Tax=Psychrilyobacter piezotolerans TaxID=2293438 RepID=A0ABX9KDV0_9FUSO|nr:MULTISPECIES: GrdX family protein [Psychrilyobacter]MCS5423124.1 GrdX family protein [Psychrilyobacter sp. S5]NDI79268.1 GrdX protein [Psychrilyobacter piezotolerans]RDE58811.1 GrdX protein [Psychrilyobacter sp. S5]REI39296.1 GrdX protein [Psychrilyobacter piezotolerans]